MKNFIESFRTSLQVNTRYVEGVKKGFNPINVDSFKRYNRFRPEGAKKLFCYLPYNSLTFSFSGQVYVCSYNRDISLGSYPENSIDEIWNGKKAQKLRSHMEYNDLDYGCQHCKFFFEKEKFSNLRPLVFDKYFENTQAAFPQVFEFELSNECNLECQMCHGEVSSSIRKNRDKLPPILSPYDDAFVQQLEQYIPNLKEAKFYGGEPFLIPIYYKIWDRIKVLNPNLELFAITNGSHWNKKIESIVTEMNFDIAISIDAIDKAKLEMIRKNIVYDKLMENIRRFSEICNKKGKHLSLSITIQKDNWEQLPLVIKLCNDVDAFVYISYLERPSRFSIADLSKEELKNIRSFMEHVSLPRFTQKERHNYNCFTDFKNYLDRYISNDNEKRYEDYGEKKSELAWEKASKNQQMVVSENSTVTEEELLSFIEKHYLEDETYQKSVSKADLVSQTFKILSSFSAQEQGFLRAQMIQTDFNRIIDSVKRFSVEELTENCRQTLINFEDNYA